MSGVIFNAELISAGLDVMSVAFTVAAIGCLFFNSIPEENRWWNLGFVCKRSLRGQHVMPRMR